MAQNKFILRINERLISLCLITFLGLGFTYGQETENPGDTLIFPLGNNSGGLYLDSNIVYEVEYDPISNQYVLWPMVGDTVVGEPTYLTFDEYMTLIQNEDMKDYYRMKSQTYDQIYREERFGDKEREKQGNILPSLKIKSKTFETIFGGDEIQLIPQGSANLDLGVFIQKIDNPMLLPQNRETLTLDLRQRIQMNILGKVGENLQLRMNYDTQAGFGFENQMKLQWRNMKDGGEDDIIQNIEVGNISMPLSTSLITGAQSLFGVRTDLKFGNTYVSAVFSEQRSETRNITVQGDGVMTDFKVFAENYEYNKHFFLGHYFRNTYDQSMERYPFIASFINITRMEVWRIDRSGGNQELRRTILGLRDLGEAGLDNSTVPTNNTANNLYSTVTALPGVRSASGANSAMSSFSFNGEPYQNGEHYIVNENVRKLNPSEYSFDAKTGYLTLTQPLVDGEDLLAVSFQFTDSRNPERIYKVGEMSDEQDQLLISKIVKSNSSVNTASPMWDLMMKNIYSLNAFNITPEDFLMNIEFKDNSENSSGTITYLPNTIVSEQTLLQVMNLDRLNLNGDIQNNQNGTMGDGLFDYVEGITVDSNTGTIIFTTVEPFGSHLEEQLGNPPPGTPAYDYVFRELYRQLPNTLQAERMAQRYSLRGRYKGAGGGGIPLGAFNVPQGSVTVTANGQVLMEGVDYTVDYQLGTVTIINQTLKDSGTPINISMENQSMFNMQKKRFIGLNVEHHFSERLIVGGTIVNYQERPLTQKTQFGAEPVNNTIVGLNTQFNGESEFLTRIANMIPGIKTSQPSQINFQAEGAYLMPGLNDAINGASYIDDFEDAQSRISLMDVFSWKYGSTPGRPAGYTSSVAHPWFPNGMTSNDLNFNNGRKRMAWYNIDPRFFGIGGNTDVTDEQLSNHRSRRVLLRELFDQRDVMAGAATYINTFDLTFYPELRGPYNVNPLITDTESWAAITRPITVPNFLDANVEYIEFWLMDPYLDGTGGNGELVLNIGNVSEDVLKDGEMLFENGLPYDGSTYTTTTTNWGVQPENYPIIYAFETEGAQRLQQDLGYNGITDAEEAVLYPNVSSDTNPLTGELDPAADNYVFYLDSRWGASGIGNSVQDRYRYFNNPQGNSSTDDPLQSSSLVPDSEDVNNDYNLDQTENYNQYTIKLDQFSLENNTSGFIVATKEVQNIPFANGQSGTAKWYQFRIPVDNFDLDLDGDGVDDLVTAEQISAARSVLSTARFMRLIMRGFEQETTLRFGTFDLVRSNWRRYTKNIFPAPNAAIREGEEIDQNIHNLEIGEVSIEQNSSNTPPYRMPPGIVREQTQGTTGYQSQNEASMLLKATLDGSSPTKGVFKNVNLDLRRYKLMEMFVHAHDLLNVMNTEYDETTKLFMRFGSDYTDNYYEYEMPLKYTAQTAISEDDIWPVENRIELATDNFIDAKKLRDTEGFSTVERFGYEIDPENPAEMVYVKGRPTLGEVTSIMIGLRTTTEETKTIQVWVNELRLREIDNEGGYAARASLGFTLGDFAQFQLNGSVSSVGFGAVDMGPSQRNQDETKEYSVNAQFQLEKLLPEKAGLQLPLNVTYGEQFIDPKYNPLDSDVEFNEAPNREELKDVVRTYSQQKSISLNNIRKVKTNNKPARFYDISNFTLNWMYADTYYRDVYTQYNITKTMRYGLNYNYTTKGKTFEPFKKWRPVQDTARSAKYLQFIKEININPIPTRFSFRTEGNRTYAERMYRDLNQFFGLASTTIYPTAASNFLFGWQYNLGFDLTRSLRVDINSQTTTLNDGSNFMYPNKSMIWNQPFAVGRTVNYNQQVQLNYKLPLRFLPYLNWINAEVGYTANYNWQATSTAIRNAFEDVNLGNMAQNSNNINLLGEFDMNKFYTEFTGYKKYDSINRARKREIDSLDRSHEELALSSSRRKAKRQSYKFKAQYRVKDYGWMVLSSIKRIQFNYSQNNGAVLPGVLSEPNFFGMGKNGGGPGFGFIYGTNFDVRRAAVENGWVSDSEYLTDPYQRIKGTNFNATAIVEPMPSLRITFNAKRNSNFRSYMSGFNLGANVYNDELYNLNSSNLNIATAFKNPDQVYEQFIENTYEVSRRLGMQSGEAQNEDGYYNHYGISSVDVLLPAFVAAVEGRSAGNVGLGHRRNIPLPNWMISYTGLTNRPFFSRYFDQIEITHGYLSSYTVSNVQSNPNYYAAYVSQTAESVFDLNDNYFTPNIYGSVSMVESFAPLVGIDMTFRNSMQLRMQYNRDRIMTMSFSNYTMTEDYGLEYIIGVGYIIRDVKVKMRYRGTPRTIKGDMNIRADFALRDNETRIRRILDNDSQVTGGQRLMSIKASIDYNLSQNFNLKFYWDQNLTEYKISTAYPISTIRAGLSATFTFGN